MKKILLSSYFQVLAGLCMCLTLLLFLPSCIVYVSADVQLTPHILSDGNKQDLQAVENYKFQSDGEQLIRLNIPENGALYADLCVQNAGFIVAEIYRNADASDLPSYMEAACTADHRNHGVLMHYFDKGTYYIRFPKNNYETDLLLYPHKAMTLKDKSVIAAYCDYTHENTYTFKAPENGYATICQETLVEQAGSLSAVLCNAKGSVLTEKAIFSNLQKNQITYAVKKGQTYKVKLKGLNVNDSQYYQIRLKLAKIKEKSGASQKKAVSVKFGNKVSGNVYAEESAKKADWYKITNPKKQQMILNYSGSITSGSMVLDVLDSKGRKLDSYSVISNIGEHKEDSLHNIKKGLQIPKGTYYLRVTKSQKTATGIYSFSISGK